MEKQCSKCNVIKDTQDFSNSKFSKDGKCCYCKNCKSQIDQKYRIANKEKIALSKATYWRTNEKVKIQNKKAVEKKRCGLYATELVKDKSCEHCGMTNDQHFTKWNERLHIDHINNDGRHNQRLGLKPNNDISNLQILCRSCHVKKDNQTRDYNKQSIFATQEIDKIISMAKESKSIRKFAMNLGYNYGTILAIVRGRNLKRFNKKI